MEHPLKTVLGPPVRAILDAVAGKDALDPHFVQGRPGYDVALNVHDALRLGGGSGRALSEEAESAVRNFSARLSDAPAVAVADPVGAFVNVRLADPFLMSRAGLPPPAPKGRRVMVEYASPNTNKPLHLGHLRNIFLGESVARILTAAGNRVVRTQVINDRGIHICKSMVAYRRYGGGETPESTGEKGDHLVGRYYVRFAKELALEAQGLMSSDTTRAQAEEATSIMREAREALRLWEEGDPGTVALWRRMDGWAVSGMEETYRRVGARFDVTYRESETYMRGKEVVARALDAGLLYRADGAVWANLAEYGLPDKVLLRADGTAVYATQDVAVASMRAEQYPGHDVVYVVGDEQDHHFKALFASLRRIGLDASGLRHLSYGMVDLVGGRMKSREGSVVDADDIVAATVAEAARVSEASAEAVGLGALKFELLRVGAGRRVVFDPSKAIDLHGRTGPFVQYAHARAYALVDRAFAEEVTPLPLGSSVPQAGMQPQERALVLQLLQEEGVLARCATELDPAPMAVYAYDLARAFNSMYHAVPVFAEGAPTAWRMGLVAAARASIARSLRCLGIEAPHQM